MESCLLGFSFTSNWQIGNANCVIVLCHVWPFGDGIFAFICCEKDQKYTVNLPERTSFEAVKTPSAPCTIHFKAYYVFQQSASVCSETYIISFSQKVPCKTLCSSTYVLQSSNPFLLLLNIVLDLDIFFSLFLS